MKIKTESSVFFVDNISAEEEYEIINRNVLKRRREPTGKLPGDRILVTGQRLLQEVKMPIADLIYDEHDEKIFNIFMCLARLPPLYNFILNFNERCLEVEEYRIISRFSKFLDLILEGKESNVNDLLVEPEATKYCDIYSELTKAIHDELCARYTFEEDVWSTTSGGNSSRFKRIYQEYSPIVEIFQGKAAFDGSQPRGALFEKIRLSFNGALTIKSALDLFLKTEKCKITKLPSILTLIVDSKSKVEILDNNDITLNNSLFSLSAFITEKNSSSYCYINSSGIWYEYGRNEVEKISKIKSFHGNRAILFYVLKE